MLIILPTRHHYNHLTAGVFFRTQQVKDQGMFGEQNLNSAANTLKVYNVANTHCITYNFAMNTKKSEKLYIFYVYDETF